MDQFRDAKGVLAGWAHDLGKPLQVIAYHGQQLLEQDGLRTETLALAREILALSEDALRVVDRLMECDPCDVDRDYGPRELRETFARVVAVVRGLHPDHDLRVRDPIPPIRLEGSVRLFSILVNLADNAMFACQADQSVYIDSRVENRWLVIEIIDRGVGMSDLVRECAFRPHYSTRRARRSAGLGLAECRRLIEECGGEIRLESVEGQGTRATVRLPLEETEPLWS